MDVHAHSVRQDCRFIRRLRSATHRAFPRIGKIFESFSSAVFHGIVNVSADTAFHLCGRGDVMLVDKGGHPGIAFVSWLYTKVRQRAANFVFFTTVCTVAKNPRVGRRETGEGVGATIRPFVPTWTLAGVADAHAQFRERTTRLVAAAHRRVSFATFFGGCQAVLRIRTAVFAFGASIRTETGTNPLHFQMKLTGYALRPKTEFRHVLQISFCGANFRMFFRTALVSFAVRVRRVASSGEVTPIVGKIVERH